MVLIMLFLNIFLQTDEDILNKILESNRRCLTDSAGSYALSEKQC